MRVQPENPGGEAAVNQGLAVNDVAANGIAADPADRLTLAPTSLGLAEDDGPVTELAITATSEPALVQPDPNSASETVASQANEIDALVAALTAGVTPMTSAPRETETTLASASAPSIVQPAPLQPATSENAVVVALAPAMLTAPGVKVSLRPLVRPARFAPSQSAAAPSQGLSLIHISEPTRPY